MMGLQLAYPTLEKVIQRIPESRLDERQDPERFTPREVVAHLADWEPILLERLEGAVQSEHFVITPHDEDERAVAGKYSEQDVMASLSRYKELNDRYVEFAKGLTDEQLNRPVIHPELGTLRAADLITFQTGHVMYHVHQLLSYTGEKTTSTW